MPRFHPGRPGLTRHVTSCQHHSALMPNGSLDLFHCSREQPRKYDFQAYRFDGGRPPTTNCRREHRVRTLRQSRSNRRRPSTSINLCGAPSSMISISTGPTTFASVWAPPPDTIPPGGTVSSPTVEVAAASTTIATTMVGLAIKRAAPSDGCSNLGAKCWDRGLRHVNPK